MNKFSRTLELEHQICDLQKDAGNVQVSLKFKQVSLTYARAGRDEARTTYWHHLTNRNYMRSRAEVVDIKEYAATVHLLTEAKELFSDRSAEVAILEAACKLFDAKLIDFLEKIEERRSELNGLGQLLQFPVQP